MSEDIQRLLDTVVTAPNEIDSIIIFDPVQTLALYANKQHDPKRNGKILLDKQDEIVGSLTNIHRITTTLTEFGNASQRGKYQYAIVQFDDGILALYFLEIHREPVVVTFISGTPEGLGLLLQHSKRSIGEIEKLLKAA